MLTCSCFSCLTLPLVSSTVMCRTVLLLPEERKIELFFYFCVFAHDEKIIMEPSTCSSLDLFVYFLFGDVV